MKQTEIELYRSDGSARWIEHPGGRNIDVAAISVYSSNRQPNQIDRLKRARLWLRCQQNETNLFVEFNLWIRRDAQQARYRIDNGPIQSIRMEKISGGDGLGLWTGQEAIPFVRSILDKQTFVIGYESKSSSATEFTFDVSGLRSRIGPLAKSCNWIP